MILVLLIIFAGALIQTLIGFGMALVAMPLLVTVLGIQVASPAFALVGITATFLNAARWHKDITWRDITILTVPALIGVPIGVMFLGRGNPEVVTRVLGVILIAYALYAFFGRSARPEAEAQPTRSVWGVAAGFVSGVLTGAFNAGGPPVVAYTSAQGWQPDRFKGNLAIIFFIMGLAVLASHAISGNLTAEVWRIALLSLPAMFVGQAVGAHLAKRISLTRFNQLVLILLVLLGVQLLF